MNTAIIGIYKEEELLVVALKKICETEIEVNEVYTPYPVHEIFKLMKRKTRLPIATFIFALSGFIGFYAFSYYISVMSYPLIYGGKPIHSVPSFILIAFVSMIGVAILLSFITFLIRTKLYPGKKPVIYDSRITDNAFVILIDKKPEMSQNDLETINKLLIENGAIEVFEK